MRIRVPGVRIPLLPLYLIISNVFWSIHLTVRIQDSQSWHRGSIPLSTTDRSPALQLDFFFSALLIEKITLIRFFLINEVIYEKFS